MKVIIYHNPNCSKSRAVLKLLEESDITPTIINYLENPPSREKIKRLALETGLPLRALLRTKDELFSQLGLDENSDENTLLAAVCNHPALLNRPIVQTEKGSQLCRPPELVFEIL